MIVCRIIEKGPSQLDEQTLASEEAKKLRRHFGVKPGRFTVILVGKDGGVKMVREERTDLQEIFDLIDSMPMGQQEMRERIKAHERFIPSGCIIFRRFLMLQKSMISPAPFHFKKNWGPHC